MLKRIYRWAIAIPPCTRAFGKSEKDDLALIVSDTPASAAAVFTQNRVQAAPVHLSAAHLQVSRGLVRAILVNAGNANCATRTGDRVALRHCAAVAVALKSTAEQVLPSSTGVIGVELNRKADHESAAGAGGRTFGQTASPTSRTRS